MIHKLCILILFICLTSCASLTYETADETKVTYKRLFTTADTIKGSVEGAKIEVGGQKIDTATLQYLLNILNSSAE